MIYHIFANRSNIGDWLSAKGIQKLLSEEVTECLCDVPFIEETMDKLSNAKPDDLIVIGGGGLLMDYFDPFWKAFQPFSKQIAFLIWGIGYCDLKNEATLPDQQLIKDIFSRAKLCILRDEMSLNHLSELNLPQPVSCPSLNYITNDTAAGIDLLHVVNYTTVGEVAYEFMCEYAKQFCKEKAIVYRQTNNLIDAGSEQQLVDLLSLYSRSEVILSSALHGCIIGVGMGKKVIAVSGDRKIDAFMEVVGLGDWVLDPHETERIPFLLEQIHKQPDVSDNTKQIQALNQNIANTINEFVRNVSTN